MELATNFLKPFGCVCEVDFTKRGGHQQLIVSHPRLKKPLSLEIVSTPRDEGHALSNMRQRCNRLVRDYGLA